MTDKKNAYSSGFVVVLGEDVNKEAAEKLLNAIKTPT